MYRIVVTGQLVRGDCLTSLVGVSKGVVDLKEVAMNGEWKYC